MGFAPNLIIGGTCPGCPRVYAYAHLQISTVLTLAYCIVRIDFQTDFYTVYTTTSHIHSVLCS